MKKMNWSAGWRCLLLLLVFGRSDRNFPLAGLLGNSAKGASFWSLILAGTAPRDDDDDGLGMVIHFAAPLFLDFTSHAVAISSCFTHSLAFPTLFFFAFPQNSRAFPLFFFSGSLDTDFFLLIIFNDLIYSSLSFFFFCFLLFFTLLRAVIKINAYTYIYRNNRTEEGKYHSHARIS